MLSGDFLGSSTNFAAAIDTVIEKTETVLRSSWAMPAPQNGRTVTETARGRTVCRRMSLSTRSSIRCSTTCFSGSARRQRSRRGARSLHRIRLPRSTAKRWGRAGAGGVGQSSNSIGVVEGRMQAMAPVIEMTRSSY